MQPELIFEAGASQMPGTVLLWALGVLALAGTWAAWLRWRGAAWHGGAKMLLAIGVILLLLSAAYRYEKHWIGEQPKQVVEGPVTGYWTKTERRRATTGSGYDTSIWEGFTVGGVAFVYHRGLPQNYFSNMGDLPVADGMRLRLTYIPEAGQVQKIVRVERLPAQ